MEPQKDAPVALGDQNVLVRENSRLPHSEAGLGASTARRDMAQQKAELLNGIHRELVLFKQY